jgi:hypothetical protein
MPHAPPTDSKPKPRLSTPMVALLVLGPCVAVPLGVLVYLLVTGLWAAARS